MNNKFLKTNYLILGAGLSGIAAAFFLNDDFLIIEKQDKIGGLCQTNSYNGFLYDFTGHLLHFKNNDIKDFVLNKLLKNNYIEQKRNSFVYLKNKFIPFPYQYNLSYLDNTQIANSILSLLLRPTKKSASLFDFFLANYGKKISSDFFIPYNYKVLNFNLKKLHYSQLYKFIPDYEEEKIIIGAFIKDKFNDIGYNSIFYYPAKNGIIELINSFNINKEKI
ncbi:MAG TPA: NAD(P)-binding protein [bacterium]|nr:NAD(P)-binding protein [bacterium]